jgi:thiol-disulfide isomerase/thioredoxin
MTAHAEKAPDFTLASLDGKMVSLADYRGRIVFLDFWATWCPPCRESIPAIARLHERFKDSDVVVLSINVEGDPVKVNRFVEQKKIMRYPVLIGNSAVKSAYGITGIPTFIVIDRDGQIIKRASGFGDSMEARWVSDLTTLCESRKPAGKSVSGR